MRISKGALAREAEMDKIKYHLSQRELDKMINAGISARKEQIKAEMNKKAEEMNAELNEAVRKEWESREQLFSDKGLDTNLIEIIALLIAISARTLVEDFGWQPLPKDGFYRKSRKLAKFCDRVAERVSAICSDDKVDIRDYNEETYELYGVRFTAEVEE